MKTVVYSDAFVPAELVAACGLRPLRLPPSRAAGASLFPVTEGLCPLARAFAASAAESPAVAVIFTTACDQMRRIHEMFATRAGRPSFLLNVPHTTGGNAFRMYVSELERLARFLCEICGICGRPPTDDELAASMARYESARRSLLALRGHLTGREFHEAIASLIAGGLSAESIAKSAAGGEVRDGVPVAVVGAPLMEADGELYDIVERCGGRVVLDATDDGEMAMPEFAPPARGSAAMERLAAGYWNIPAALRRPNDLLYEYLDRELASRGVRGIILRRYAWCDTWHAEVGRMRRRYSQSLLDLDVSEPLSEHSLTRIEAFMEAMRER